MADEPTLEAGGGTHKPPALDAALVQAWRDAARPEKGLFFSYFSDFNFKTIPNAAGTHFIIAAYNAKHWAAKRGGAAVVNTEPDKLDCPMEAPFAPDRFNFNKIKPAERLYRLNLAGTSQLSLLDPASSDAKGPDVFCINVSPMFTGHALLLPEPANEHSQRLQGWAIERGLRFAAACSSECRLFFNSRGAFSSVNHLHYHFISLAGAGDAMACPVELLPTEHVAERRGAVLSRVLGWGCEVLLLRLGAEAEAEAGALAAAADSLTEVLYTQTVPFHVVIAEQGNAMYFYPRQNQAVQERTDGFRMAVVEVAGFAAVKSQEEWDEVTYESYMERMRSTLSITPEKVCELTAAWAAR